MGSSRVQYTLPNLNEEGEITVEAVVVLERRLGKEGHKTAVYLLVQWSIGSREDATPELYSDMEKRFPHLNLTA